MAKELNDLAAVRRQLQRFRQNGTLKPEAVDRLLGRLQNIASACCSLLRRSVPRRSSLH